MAAFLAYVAVYRTIAHAPYSTWGAEPHPRPRGGQHTPVGVNGWRGSNYDAFDRAIRCGKSSGVGSVYNGEGIAYFVMGTMRFSILSVGVPVAAYEVAFLKMCWFVD